MEKTNLMRTIRVEKVTLNVGAGKDQGKLDKGLKLLNMITSKNPVKTKTTKRIPGWGLRPGLPIGCKVTVRKEDANKLLKRLLFAVDFIIPQKQFDEHGNVALGVSEYVDIEGMEYDPEIGAFGLQICVTLERPGFRIKKRRKCLTKLNHRHKITKDEAIEFMKSNFNVKLAEDE
ncbi:50S ribosomal protein L5 [Candidatus Woesearchaeota archaeon]|jgi:large subunit ribosomal protein L5|nr:50S ribosomal protein L5 [Candidatus Woesearchaeota archaeon]MBT6520306.1 50S ribosomal protein L5 [Candidatus Woesearchaeota archaeon]MBT7368258.1 50S ribosomal protein L5 [Candidatus Woesearchaeota archaeon]